MISAASNIRSVSEVLKKVTVRHLYDALRNPRESTMSLLRQLRIIRQLDASQYSLLKRNLPYFVCAMFNPPFRKTENFAYTEYFVIDIDHLSDKGLVATDVRAKIQADARTLLCFLSPGGDGLKVMMKFKERCYDAGLYTAFYRVFLQKFSRQYALEQVVDSKTCDVTRACFLSADEEVYYNPLPECVDISQFLSPDEDVSLAFEEMHRSENACREVEKKRQEEEKKGDPGGDILADIRATLGFKKGIKPKKPEAYVPEELNDVMRDLQSYVESKGIVLCEVINIQYGKKLRFKLAGRKAEINLFFGHRRGFTVVQSPRTGTDKDANELMADVVNGFLMER